MKKLLLALSLMNLSVAFCQTEKLIYHEIVTDASGKIIPWYSDEMGKAYSSAIMSLWHFWDTMRIDMNGLPYYMNHQVWTPGVNDLRGIGGDQLQMALSSWRLLYSYAGDNRIKENMKFMADYYLSHGLSPSTAAWPNIPYPYNTLIYSGIYDGDMVIGKYYTQPDKAGSFGNELVQLYKLIGNRNHGQTPGGIYLESAIKIANTLARHTVAGDYQSSPLPFKVHALIGKVGQLKDNHGSGANVQLSNYTSNWSATMELFLALIEMKKGDTQAYQKAFDMLLVWMKKYPLQNNRWGPFFEDVPGWSDTQINAITFAQFMMNHRQYFPDWKAKVNEIFKWVYATLGNNKWERYGVIVVNEQTAYQTPGNSHSSRQASAELQYTALTGDSSYKENAIRTLNWATYMVDTDGKNRYPQDENWLTDGYGDYVRHYLRAFAAIPELAPSDEDHILSTTSVIQFAEYKNSPYKKFQFDEEPSGTIKLKYTTYDKQGSEVIRLASKPTKILFNRKVANENIGDKEEGFQWHTLPVGGLLIIKRTNAYDVVIME
jgi:hypothetical protein